MTDVIILGAGGHAQVVADILLRSDDRNVRLVGFLDDNPALHGKTYLGRSVFGPISLLPETPHDAVVLGIGNNALRRRLFLQLQEGGERFVRAIHPRATVAPDVTIEVGTMICAGVVVNTGSRIGENAILNTACTVDHHNEIGDHCHIAPGAHLGGEVAIGSGSLVGIGAIVMPRCRVGARAIVGAGALVTGDVDAGQTVTGMPARPQRR